MQFVKFGEEYVAVSSILRVVFRTDKETQASGSAPICTARSRKT